MANELTDIFNMLKKEVSGKIDEAKYKRENKSKKKLPGWLKATLISLGIILGFFLIAWIAAFIVTDYFWFEQVDYSIVWQTNFYTPVICFWIGFIIAFALIIATLFYSYSKRPTFSFEDESLLVLEKWIIRTHKVTFSVISAVLAMIFGFVFASFWENFLLFWNLEEFGSTDAIFGLDQSFYVFILPVLNNILNYLIGLFAVCLILSLIFNIFFQSIKIEDKKLFFGKNPKVQTIIYTVLFFIFVAVRIFLAQYSVLTKQGTRVTGADYTDANFFIPINSFMAGVTLVLGIVGLIYILKQKYKGAIFSFAGIFLLFAILEGVVPFAVQKLIADPNAQSIEAEYIQNNIEATYDSYNLTGNLEITDYSAKTDASSTEILADAETTAQIRLLDPQIISPTFRQLQQNKQYYNFADTLAVDKYEINGKEQDTVIAAREIYLEGNDQRNWINDHTVFTHGFGVVAAYGNQVSTDGSPLFYEKDIPTVGYLTEDEDYEPRIYFSPNAPDYSVVGTASGSDEAWEFDYPTDNNNGSAYTVFEGDGGPKTTNWLTKLLYAFRFGSLEILFSDRVTDNSQILYYRDPTERVQKVAPYLLIDGRVYPAVIDGKVKWIVDGYTVSDKYPYGQMVNLLDVTQDALTANSSAYNALKSTNANYIRNSVKATVDAYDGSVTLYAWDDEDPLLKTYSKIYQNTVKPLSDIDGELMSHIRYPESMFKVQRYILSKYHLSSAAQFFSGEDFWQIPYDPTGLVQTVTYEDENGETYTVQQQLYQPPYYLTLKVPGEKEPIFSLSSVFIPGGDTDREILTGFLAASSDAGDEAGVIGENYGKLQLLELPKNSTVPGPGQAQNNFNSNAAVSQALNLLEQGSSEISRGNLLTLPIAGGLLYVQPVYVQSSGNTKFPLLRKVLVSFGEKVGFADTLSEAMDQIFNDSSSSNNSDDNNDNSDNSGGSGGNSDNSGSGTVSPTPTPSPTAGTVSPEPTPTTTTSPSTDAELIEKIRETWKKIQDAYDSQDWDTYGDAQKELAELLSQ